MEMQNYGDYFWCVKVPQEISPDGEIYVNAQKAEITSNGDLIFWSSITEKRNEPFQNLSLARGSWMAFYIASPLGGGAVAIDTWEGEVIREA